MTGLSPFSWFERKLYSYESINFVKFVLDICEPMDILRRSKSQISCSVCDFVRLVTRGMDANELAETGILIREYDDDG